MLCSRSRRLPRVWSCPLPRQTLNAGGVAEPGRAEERLTASLPPAPGPRAGARFQALRTRTSPPAALGRPGRRGRRAPAGRRANKELSPAWGQSACQTRACAVCTASVLWVSAAATAAAAAGASVAPRPRRLQPLAPRASTRCGTRRGAKGQGGAGDARPPSRRGDGARGEDPEHRAWGRGAGGAGEHPESRLRRRRRNGACRRDRVGAPGCTCARMGGRPYPVPARHPGPAPVGVPDAPQKERGLSARRQERWPRGAGQRGARGGHE